MRFSDQVLESLARLNGDLARQGDRARVRHALIESDPYQDDRLLVLATWELPDPFSGAETWPLEELDRYVELTARALEDLTPAVECLFRTHDELAGDARLGTPVPELV
jgi:hypothetical protein